MTSTIKTFDKLLDFSEPFDKNTDHMTLFNSIWWA
jgi:hypothetical protein